MPSVQSSADTPGTWRSDRRLIREEKHIVTSTPHAPRAKGHQKTSLLELAIPAHEFCFDNRPRALHALLRFSGGLVRETSRALVMKVRVYLSYEKIVRIKARK